LNAKVLWGADTNVQAEIGIERLFSSHQLAMPAKNRCRLEESNDLTKLCYQQPTATLDCDAS